MYGRVKDDKCLVFSITFPKGKKPLKISCRRVHLATVFSLACFGEELSG